MDRIEELIGKLDTLTEQEVGELVGLILEEHAKADQAELTASTAAQLTRLGSFAAKVNAHRVTREMSAAVTASGGQQRSGVAAMAASRAGRKAEGSPEASRVGSGSGPRVLLATGAASYAAEPVTDRLALGEAMCEHLRRMSRTGPPRGVALVASAHFDYPEDRQLGGDSMVNLTRLESAVGLSALLASGGICLPVNVDYDIPMWATAERPLKEALPAFLATRGGLRFVEPPTLAALSAATGIWTEATDAEPGAATKPVLSVSCGTEELVYVSAVSTRLGIGNMQSRFQPEMVAANTDLAIAYAARKAELNLLELIQTHCVKDVTSGKVLGATRDLITAINQGAANFRFTHRTPREVALTAVFPAWVLDLIKIDLARETAHQQGTDWNSLAITDEQVIDMLKAHGINPIFTLDGLGEEAGKYPTQTFAAQTAEGAIKAFPAKLVWNLFPEGSIQFLDGGRLDLGVVRDSTLDATNDYETFVETFEGIADRGFSKSAIQFVTELCANGKSGATETVSTCA